MEALKGNSCPEGLSTVQVLVALLRVLGLRARLVLSLKPLPFKQSAKVQGVASAVVGGATCSLSEECAVKEQSLMEKGCPDRTIILSSSVASCSSSKTNQEGCPVLNGSGNSLACGKQRGHGQKRTKFSPEEEGGGEASKGYRGKGKKPKKEDEPRPPTAKEVTEEVGTPVASKKLKGGGGRRMKKDATPPPTERKRTLRSNSKICSTDVADDQGGRADDQGGGANGGEGEDDDISIVMSPKAKRKRQLVPSHRDAAVEDEGPTPHPCGGFCRLLVKFSLFRSVPIQSYAMPRRRPCSRTGYEDGQYPTTIKYRKVPHIIPPSAPIEECFLNARISGNHQRWAKTTIDNPFYLEKRNSLVPALVVTETRVFFRWVRGYYMRDFTVYSRCYILVNNRLNGKCKTHN